MAEIINGKISNLDHKKGENIFTTFLESKSFLASDTPYNDYDNNNNNNNNNSTNLKIPTSVSYENINEEIISKGSTLQEFYHGMNVFITGGTGFMGKILVDKLLRSCPDIGNIYLLVRNKKGKDIHTRVDEIFDDPLFDLLRKTVPKFRHKLEVVAGDASLPGLGLDLIDRQTIIDKVNIVFHAAATVRFDEKISLAIATNVEGVRAMLDIAKSMKNLKSLVHVSTAYTNSHRPDPIGETFVKHPQHYTDVINIISKMDEKTLIKQTPELLGPWPNTYAFTKALAEDLIRENCEGIPIGMFRPAIVTPTYKEPVVGWIDNLYGPTGVIAGAGTGVLRTLHCDESLNANIVPVDYCVNALIASAWDIANNANERTGDNMLIYNYVSSSENPITWYDLCNNIVQYGFKYPFSTAVWYYSLTLNKSAFWNKVYSVVFHYIPAILIDSLAMCVGQKPRLLKVYKKVHKFSEVISHFCTNEWKFSNDNVQKLWLKTDKIDKKIFPFSMKDVDWVEYFTYYMKGMRTYLFKEQATQEEALRKWKRFYVFHILLKSTVVASLSYGLWTLLYWLLLGRTSKV